MSVSIKMDGFKRAVLRQAPSIIENKADNLRAIIIDDISRQGTGREYRLRDGRRHQASAPGRPPAKQTGGLVESVSEPDVRQVGGGVIGRITIGARYAIHLERGTGRMAPRPFVRPAIEEWLRGQV